VNFPIDIVITWVNQDDPKWLAKYKQYKMGDHDEDVATRFRDYGTLPYVFRSIEKFAPWVHKVFLITDDQAPDWLNDRYEKLVLVNHTDYIDSRYLPTFDSNLIELSLINLEALSEHFICFNDDCFFNKPVQPSDFFDEHGNPKDTLAFNAIMPMSIFDHIHVNNMAIINNRYDKRERIKHLLPKLFNWHNGRWNLFTFLLLAWPRFTRFYDPHIPISFLKSTTQKMITEHPEIISATGADHFRSERDYSNWVVRYEQMLSGAFTPRKYDFGVQYSLVNVEAAIADIESSKHALLNINDSNQLDDQAFASATQALEACFTRKFPEQSQFEA
jgi:hypothetical protein